MRPECHRCCVAMTYWFFFSRMTCVMERMKPADTTLIDLLREATQRRPEAVFVHGTHAGGENVAITFRQLHESSGRIAAGLLERGLRRGDRIAIAAPNHVEWLELFFGAARIGVAVVTLNVRYRASELDYMINQAGARLVVSAAGDGDFDFEEFYAGFRDRIPSVEEVVFLNGSSFEQSFERLYAEPVTELLDTAEKAVTGDDPAAILYTSGTTGTPKGAVLTHGSIVGAAAAQVEHFQSSHDDVYLGVMPLNHVGGLTCTITAALVTCSTVVLPAAFSPKAALAAMEHYGVTIFAGVPTMWQLMTGDETLADRNVQSVRLCVIGGSNVEPAMAERIKGVFAGAGLANLYGLSETSGAAVISPPDDSTEMVSRSIGVTLPGIEARVTGVDGATVPTGQEGELQVRGPGTAAGYWDLPEATAETFLADGWVATGDMVSQEPDGHIILRGRRKEMFVQGGYNVYPVEVENVLTAHPTVSMAAGFGVPDPVLGEIGCYYIMAAPGHEVSEDELRAFCAERLANYKVPRQIVITDALPTTPAGKIAKAVLREQHDAE